MLWVHVGATGVGSNAYFSLLVFHNAKMGCAVVRSLFVYIYFFCHRHPSFIVIAGVA